MAETTPDDLTEFDRPNAILTNRQREMLLWKIMSEEQREESDIEPLSEHAQSTQMERLRNRLIQAVIDMALIDEALTPADLTTFDSKTADLDGPEARMFFDGIIGMTKLAFLLSDSGWIEPEQLLGTALTEFIDEKHRTIVGGDYEIPFGLYLDMEFDDPELDRDELVAKYQKDKQELTDKEKEAVLTFSNFLFHHSNTVEAAAE